MKAFTHTSPIPETEQGLDPQDWSGLRQLGHRMIDDMFDHLATAAERPL
jgi:aromatic-L-amino-acid/L-tryptophan decarboxylase